MPVRPLLVCAALAVVLPLGAFAAAGWSPKGTLAFVSDCQGGYDIYVMNTDTSGGRQADAKSGGRRRSRLVA